MGDRKEYAESKLWTNYLPASTSSSSIIDVVNPFAWIRNLAGGGDMQRDRLAIADLEVKAATLEAARAELERQREQCCVRKCYWLGILRLCQPQQHFAATDSRM
jgi:hypothetical protein